MTHSYLINGLESALSSARKRQEQKRQTEMLRGPKGEKGERGPAGKDGYTPRKGIDYFDGKDGRDGKDGKDGESIVGPVGPIGPKGDAGDPAIANMQEVDDAISHQLTAHTAEFDHKLIDPFLLGTKTVDESTIGKGKLLSFNGEKLVYVEPPKKERIPVGRGGGGGDRWRGRIVTDDYTVDPHDQIIHIDASAGDITVTFYSAVSNDWRHHYVKRVDSSTNTVTLVLQGSETLEFEMDDVLPNRGSGREVYSDGSNWFHKHA